MKSLHFALRMSWWIPVLAFATLGLGQDGSATDPGRAIQSVPRGIPDAGAHPGNVFLLGELVTLASPQGMPPAVVWQVADEQGREVGRGTRGEQPTASMDVGRLGIGWYRISFRNAAEQEVAWTTAAVLSPLQAPTPQDSPICVDSATAWFAKNDPGKQEQLSRLAALSGVNWVRDRLRWRDLQPTRERFADSTTYDTSAELQHRFGLNVLQVFHDTPPWAAAAPRETGRFPGDLRAVYQFGQALSRRYQGKVQAWEPWNEANVATFGGHTMDEICSYQKAAYLGFKAGDPQVTVCWNATTGVPTNDQTAGVLENETWSYFDTFNFHTYDWSHGYEALWEPVRRAACGKPLWITESDRGIESDPASPRGDLSPDNDRKKAQYITQSYATSLFAGADRHFHFILGQYSEGKTQFGLLREDMTPRPGYVALATLGRLLAGARCLGRYDIAEQADVHIYAFRSRPDGEERDVLVTWAETTADWPQRGGCTLPWSPPIQLKIEKCCDYLGRSVAVETITALTSSPIYLVLPRGACDSLPLRLSSRAELRTGSPCSVVLQCLLPKSTSERVERTAWAWEIEHTIPCDTAVVVPLYIYNFSDQTVRGEIVVERLPGDTSITPDRWEVVLEPQERRLLPAQVRISKDSGSEWIKLRGDFGAAGRPVLALRLRSSQSETTKDK
ncbi:MAG: hypothetical protein ACYC3X_16965 [Pirellulaceae bacterium]